MRMNKDGLFKIMQITDMQEIPKVSPDTMALLDAAIEDEKPDLVVYTGDQIKGYGVSYKGKGKELENAVAKTINTLLEPVTKRNIPFAVPSVITIGRLVSPIKTSSTIYIKPYQIA